MVKAAAHFDGTEVDVVSSFRDGARPGSHHRSGDALDWSLRGVAAAKLAAYLRRGARVGVGVYTHPRTQFVHLDVREQSYHWADASPPGRSWRESAHDGPRRARRGTRRTGRTRTSRTGPPEPRRRWTPTADAAHARIHRKVRLIRSPLRPPSARRAGRSAASSTGAATARCTRPCWKWRGLGAPPVRHGQ